MVGMWGKHTMEGDWIRPLPLPKMVDRSRTVKLRCHAFEIIPSLIPFFISLHDMDLPILAIAKWATLLVDIYCPRGGS